MKVNFRSFWSAWASGDGSINSLGGLGNVAKDTFRSLLMEECGHKCSRPPLNVVSVNGCQDVKPKVMTAPNGALDSARAPQPGAWLVNAGGSGREGKEDAASGGREDGGARWTEVDRTSSV